MIVANSNAMATIMASSNAIAMTLIMTVINGVVVRPMGATLSMVSLTSIIMVGVAVIDGMMIVLTDITILGIVKRWKEHTCAAKLTSVSSLNSVLYMS